jgi:hypothetical protein
MILRFHNVLDSKSTGCLRSCLRAKASNNREVFLMMSFLLFARILSHLFVIINQLMPLQFASYLGYC